MVLNFGAHLKPRAAVARSDLGQGNTVTLDCWVPFVANRLAKIHDTLDELKQYQPEVSYVNSKENFHVEKTYWNQPLLPLASKSSFTELNLCKQKLSSVCLVVPLWLAVL
jgi:hypothetical protein